MSATQYFVYILYSESIDKFYIGQTEDIDTRMVEHAMKIFKGSFTTQTNDWQVFVLITCTSRKQAVNIENHIKRMKSKKYIKNLLKYPAIVDNLKISYPG